MTWACPCNGCKKAQKVIIDQIIEEYKRCLNIVESEDKLFCYTWWRHDDCERLRELLFKITKDDKYTQNGHNTFFQEYTECSSCSLDNHH